MREILGKLSVELKKHTTPQTVVKDSAYPINNFRELVEHTAKLSYINKDLILFYRGQNNDYKNKADKSSFYPSIYRGEYLRKENLKQKFIYLDNASELLVKKFQEKKIIGRTELARKKYIQWSILQHYEVCDTPLIDVTQSLRVASSFATMDNKSNSAFIYVFGLPYYHNRISIDSEHDLVNIRLLSIMPPEALRAYFQEGYLVGTGDITYNYKSKSELDLNNRLIAKFKILNIDSFWGEGFEEIPADVLYPDNDVILEICNEIKSELNNLKVYI